MRFVLLLIALFLMFCKQPNERLNSFSIDKFTLKESGVKKFALDNQTSFRALFLTTWTDSLGNQFLLFLNDDKPSIQFFDLKTDKLSREILLSIDGPNGVGRPSGLIPYSDRFIFVISSGQYRVSLINPKGELIKGYRLLDGKMNVSTGMLRPFTTSPGVMIGKKLYFNVAPDRDIYDKTYYQGHTNLVLDLESGKYEYFNTYPESFNGGVWGVAGVSYSTTYNATINKFVYSFAVHDSLVTYDPIIKKRESFFSGSRFVRKKAEPMPKPSNAHDLEYALKTPYYSSIIYDQYRKVYYRFVKHSMEYKDAAGRVHEFHEKPLSVIILNGNFEILGEKMLATNRYVDFLYFVTEEGLFVSNGNPANPDLNEDFAEYTCFKIDSLK